MYDLNELKTKLKPIGKLNMMSMKDDIRKLQYELEESEKIESVCVASKGLSQFIVLLTEERIIITRNKQSQSGVKSFKLSNMSELYVYHKTTVNSLVFLYEGEQQRINLNQDKPGKQFEQSLRYKAGDKFESEHSGDTERELETTILKDHEADYLQSNILKQDEDILVVLHCAYESMKNDPGIGLLIATNQRLLFVRLKKGNHYQQAWEYSKINGVQEEKRLLNPKLYITIGRTTKEFSHTRGGEKKQKLISTIKKYMKNPPEKKMKSETVPDKYKQLEQLGKLKKEGILTEEEFQAEKNNILSN